MFEDIRPVYLNKISLKNIKCFGPKQILSLGESNKPKMWTMILGDNGTGKSTLLKAIALAFIKEQHEKSTNYKDFLKKNKIEGEIVVDVFELKNSKKSSFKIKEKLRINIHKPNFKGSNVPIFGYGSYRKLGTQGLTIDKSSFQFQSLFDENTNLINAEDWLLKADYETVKSNAPNLKVERVRSILLNILRKEISDIKINKKEFGFGVDFKTKYGWVNIKNLSSGYKSLITWMVDLANWLFIYYPSSINPLLEKAIVLIDEIDLHLHVSLQKNLVSFLRNTFPNIQFICTAHSPLVVQGSEDENIIVLTNNDDHVLIKNNPVNVKSWRIDQLLTSDLFGLDSSRSLLTENKLRRRSELLAKQKLSKSEKIEIKNLNEYIHGLPTNENLENNEASKIIQAAAETLKRMKRKKDD